MFGACVISGWLVFHMMVRNQEFLTRLELPLFVLSPFLWPAFAAPKLRAALLRSTLLRLAAIVSVGVGSFYTLKNVFRPATIEALGNVGRVGFYYVAHADLIPPHDAVLRALESTGCKSLGLYIGVDSYDYPLTWRAMSRGVAVHHHRGAVSAPCLIYSDQGKPPGGGDAAWVAHGRADIFVPAKPRP